MGRVVRIGNGQGFWGDSPDAAYELITRGPLDYLGLDYLAEVTLSIMMRQKLKDPSKGYATDFLNFLRRALPEIVARNVKVVTNAGGLNPGACREEVFRVARALGIRHLKVGVIEGDGILHRVPELCAKGVHLKHMETGECVCSLPAGALLSANAYLGARPVAEALNAGAQIVLAGRITDTALVLGPLVAEFGWGPEDWDLLAAGTVGGHIVECGAQCTGGNFTRWWEVPDLWDVGYPVLECHEDGSFTVTKHPGTGGLVTVDTVREQLLYEMGDPKEYITPDCIADFSSIELEQEGENRVRVFGIQGRPKTAFLKVSASVFAGWKASGQLVISGPRAVEKAKLCAEIVWRRLEKAGVTFHEGERLVEFLGTGVCHSGLVTPPADLPEVVLRLGVKSQSRDAVERFGMELAPLVTSGPPGVTGFAGGRPKPQEVVAFWPALIPREEVEPYVNVSVETLG
ncbi:MAG: acyclic terpene utilization AtuA family protein [Thermoanaerobaculum sp.]